MSIKKKVSSKDFEKEKVLITCGATREYLDPIRFLSNPSSGIMGFCLANEFYFRGADLEIISGYVEENFEYFPNYFKYESSDKMAEHIMKDLDNYSVIIKSAAVGDFKFKQKKNKKLKKNNDELFFEMENTIDILEQIGLNKKDKQILVGFSAETDDVVNNSLEKIHKKKTYL